MRHLLWLLPLLLTQCVDPYGNPMPLFGGYTPPPYTENREQYRNQMREHDRSLSSSAYEQGRSTGWNDARSGYPRDPRRGMQRLAPAQASAFENGYLEGYALGSQAPAPGGTSPPLPPPYPPSTGSGTISPYPGSNPAPANDNVYSQGYDYGMRDRAAGRPRDPDAHTGRYDPRHRRSFERGYMDAYP